jgi:tetratricopeptide (TPR) repeat protein
LYNEGAEAWGNEDLATAREAFSKADLISDGEPFVPYNLASVLVSEGDVAGALPLFKKTIAMGQKEGEYEESYVTSLFNVGRLHHMLEQWDSAAVWYAQYRQVMPDDPEAINGMLRVLKAAGRDEDALTFTDTILVHADVLTDIDMFSAGVALFQADRFEVSARAFLAGLAKNRHYRDGVYNLAQSYFALANPAGREEGEDVSPEEEKAREEAALRMLEVSQHLLEIDPSNENSLRLLAAAYQLTGDTTSTLNLLEQIEELTFDVKVELFEPANGGYQVQGTISNLKEEDTTVPDLVFEFVDADGEVVAAETVFGTTLASKGSARFEFNLLGDGIAAWRYKVGG